MLFFSVIIPTYNRGHLICAAIDSVLNQYFNDFEIILVDDGSVDHTKELIQKYLNGSNIQYFFQENKGVCAARNYGVSKANGKYLVFLDSDDSVEMNWLQDFARLLQNGNYDLAFCSINEQLSNGTFRIKPARDSKKEGRSSGNFIPGSFCIRKDFFLQAGAYDAAIRYGENTELAFRLQQFHPAIGFVDNANLIYKASADGGSKNWKNKLESTLYILEKHTEMFQQNKRVKSLYYGVAALAAFKCGQVTEARSLFVRSFLARPQNWKTWLRLIVINIPFLANRIWK